MTKDKLRQLSGDERLGQMRDSEYLGAEDIDDGTEPILTIAGLWYGSVTLQRGKENNKSRLTIRRGRALQLSHGHSERSRTQEAAPAEQPTSVQRTPVFNPRLPIPSSRDFVSAG